MMKPASKSLMKDALFELETVDNAFPSSSLGGILSTPDNAHLLNHVYKDTFVHIFPGDRPKYKEVQFFEDLESELIQAASFHLWTILPICKYRCNFCQFPILTSSRNKSHLQSLAHQWVDANIAEAKLWIKAAPSLTSRPVGEFCLFGGTPTALPVHELIRLMDYFTKNFNFHSSTSLRVEGSPDTLSRSMLIELYKMGFRALTYGIQSFDDELLRIANRGHNGADAMRVIQDAWEVGFTRVDGDLIYGLPGQTVHGFLSDVEKMIALDFSTIQMVKLHIRSFNEVDLAIGNPLQAVWEKPRNREKLARLGYRWPSLGEQYQMREQGDDLLSTAGYYEHPATYFPKQTIGPERWRSLNLDHNKQYPQIGIGLGCYSWNSRSEANMIASPTEYLNTLHQNRLPFDSITGISNREREVRAVRMALSTCQPLEDKIHRQRFDNQSLFREYWKPKFVDMERRGLLSLNHAASQILLTKEGRSLVEAIIAIEI